MRRSPGRPRLAAACAAALLACNAPAFAMSLREAAAQALQHDPRLRAAADDTRAAAADVEIARAGYRPNLTLEVGSNLSRYYLNDLPAGFPSLGPLNPIYESLTAGQALYSGGELDARLRQAGGRLAAARETEEQARQQLLLAAVTAYLDVVRDRAVVELDRASLQTLEQALSDAQKRFEVGSATRTDVAQAQARVAGAQADLQRAQAAERVSEAHFERVIGTRPDTLSTDWPQPPLPATLEQALAAVDRAPAVRAAQAQGAAARAQIDAARAAQRPHLALLGKVANQDDTMFSPDGYYDWSVQVQASLPLYTGGADRARIAQAAAAADSAQAAADDARRAAAESIAAAWSWLGAAAEVIRADEANVQASTLALDDVRKELAAGTRTTLDLLNAERDRLAAQVDLAASRHDRAVAAYQLLAACGRLRLEDLP